MIRGNYSLAKDIRKNEQKNKQKIQSRQRHQSKIEQLSSIDPIKLFLQLQRLEKISDPDQYQKQKLSKLRQDWSFVLKYKLHEEKVKSFLATREAIEDAKEKEHRKLRGKQSVYFNPELNPLGKVPDQSNLLDSGSTFPNVAKPVIAFHKYEEDPLIRQLDIRPPDGIPPTFYKKVQNTQRRATKSSRSGSEEGNKVRLEAEKYNDNLDTDSDNKSSSDA